MNAAQMAARENQQQTAQSDSSPPSGTGFGTSVEAMLSHYQRLELTLPYSNWQVEIQALPPGDFLTIYGSAFDALMTAAGLDTQDNAARKQFQQTLTPRQQAVIADSNMRNFRRIAAKAIISVPVSVEEQYLCLPGVLSIYQIADAEIVYINKEVEKLSGWSTDADRFQGSVSDTGDG